MNFSFLLSGAISVNPQMILVSFILLSGSRNTELIGLDRWIMPFLRTRLPGLR